MKRIALSLLLLACTAFAQPTIGPQWSRVTDLYINTEPPRQYIGPFFVNSYTGVGPTSGTWQVVDLTAYPWNLPTDARWADLRGILILTGGSAYESADLGVIFRTPGDARVACTVPHYTGQTTFLTHTLGIDEWGQIAALSGNPRKVITGGSRSTMTTWVPLQNGRVEWCWTRTTAGNWPGNTSYGVNLSVQAWAR